MDEHPLALPSPADPGFLANDLLTADFIARAFLQSYREPTRSTYRRSLARWVQRCVEAGVDPVTADRV